MKILEKYFKDIITMTTVLVFVLSFVLTKSLSLSTIIALSLQITLMLIISIKIIDDRISVYDLLQIFLRSLIYMFFCICMR